MELGDYPRPPRDNGRGLHWNPSPYHSYDLDRWLARLVALNIRWLKVLDDGGGSSLRLCAALVDNGIMPIVRLYRDTPNPGHIGHREEQTLRALARLGVRYVETNNEPDLQVEWSVPRPADWLRQAVDNWLYDAGKCLDAGALPAAPALSVGRRDDIVAAIVERGGRDALLSGAWLAIHNYALNHPLEYPDDDVHQRGAALSAAQYAADGAWAWDGVPLETINAWRWQDRRPGVTISDDSSAFRYFEYADALCRQALGCSLPIISTEGGVVLAWRDDRRYPRVTPALQTERTVAMFDYMQTAAPPYYFAVCPWLAANYELGHLNPTWESQSWFSHWWDAQFGLNGQLPVVDAVMAMPTLARLERERPHHSEIRGDVEAMRGVGGLRLYLRGEGFGAATATAPDGQFSVANLAGGVYTLHCAGLVKAGLQTDGTNTIVLAGLRPPVAAAPELDWDTRLSDMNVTVTPAEAKPGKAIWKLVRAALDPQTQGVFFDVLDELGHGLAGQEVILSWAGGMGRKATEQRDLPAHGADFPIGGSYNPSAGPGPYSAWVDGLPGERVIGLGLPHGQPAGFVLAFQRAPAPGQSGSRIEGTVSGGKAGQAVVLHTPGGATRRTATDGSGRFAFANLPPGSYSLELAGQGPVVTDLALDGSNPLVFDYAMPAQTGVLTGTVIGGRAGLEVMLEEDGGESRRSTIDAGGVYAFRFLPAGSYTLRAGDEHVSGLYVDGLGTVHVPPLDVRPRRSAIGGVVRSSAGRALAAVVVGLVGPALALRTASDERGQYAFGGLRPGDYTLSAGDVHQQVTVDGQQSVTLDFTLASPAVPKALERVVLFGPPDASGAEVALRLARPYLRAFGATVCFDMNEALAAKEVLIIGDLQAVPADAESRLREAGCTVARVGGTPYTVEETLARLIQAKTPLPRGRTNLAAPGRRRGGR